MITETIRGVLIIAGLLFIYATGFYMGYGKGTQDLEDITFVVQKIGDDINEIDGEVKNDGN